VFENRVLRRIFGPRRDEVTGGWRKQHNEELHNLFLFAKYNCNDLVKEDEMGGTCSTKGEKRNAYRLLGKPEEERSFGRPRRRWVNNTRSKMDLGEIRLGSTDWIGLVQDRCK
jgi:hypothetical protein